MKITLTTNELARKLQNGECEYSSFSRKASYALAEHLEQLEEDCGESMELDLVAIRCEYSEHESILDFCDYYFGSGCGKGRDERVPDFDDSDDLEKWVEEYILDNGTLIKFDGGIIVSEF